MFFPPRAVIAASAGALQVSTLCLMHLAALHDYSRPHFPGSLFLSGRLCFWPEAGWCWCRSVRIDYPARESSLPDLHSLVGGGHPLNSTSASEQVEMDTIHLFPRFCFECLPTLKLKSFVLHKLVLKGDSDACFGWV